MICTPTLFRVKVYRIYFWTWMNKHKFIVPFLSDICILLIWRIFIQLSILKGYKSSVEKLKNLLRFYYDVLKSGKYFTKLFRFCKQDSVEIFQVIKTHWKHVETYYACIHTYYTLHTHTNKLPDIFIYLDFILSF